MKTAFLISFGAKNRDMLPAEVAFEMSSAVATRVIEIYPKKPNCDRVLFCITALELDLPVTPTLILHHVLLV